jgi:RNA polymerase sigma-70 factor (ECF subfamily)
MSLSAEGGSGEPLADRVAGKHRPVDAALLAGEASAALNEALEKLDVTTRDMILLRHFGQMSFKEIGELLGSPLGTVLARVHRGLKALRRIMGEDNADA